MGNLNLPSIILFLVLLAACGSTGTATPLEPVLTSTLPAEESPTGTSNEAPPAGDAGPLEGTWRGVLTSFSDGTGYQVLLTITPGEGAAFTGTLLTSSFYMLEEHPITGTLAEDQFRFEEPGGSTYWGTFAGGVLTGSAGTDCYDCSAWGQFTLGLGEPPSTGEVSFLDLEDGSTVTLEQGPLGPQVETKVRAAPMGDQGRLFLQADGLMMDMHRSNDVLTYSTILTWWPWHGNGDYELQLTSWPMDLCCRQAVQTITVTVSGFPSSQPTITDRFIQLYQQNFNLNLSAPVIARYLKPIEGAIDASRWVSAAYIADKMYEIDIFDDGTSRAISRPIGHRIPGDDPMCRPAGEFDMLFAFVDYKNTGITEEEAMAALAEAEAEYNRFYLEQAENAGVSTPILQIHVTGVYLDSPPVRGQVLTPAEIAARTGQDPSQYDLLAEVDLDSTMSVSSQLAGMGFGGTGCFDEGSPYVNIYFVLTSAREMDFSGTIFDHELSHSLGWMHWWANLDGSVETQGTVDMVHNASFPTRLFGWIDTDGDGVVEILDPTPYGMTP
jgi:hypothetical protein